MKRVCDQIAAVLIGGFVLLVVADVVVPVLYAVAMSIDPRPYIGPFPPPGISFRWYRQFFGDDRYMRALGTSLALAFTAGFVSTVLGTLAALGLSHAPGRRRALAGGMFSMPQLVPHVVLGFALLLTLAAAGWGGGFLALLCAHGIITLPYVVRSVGAALVGLRPSLIEAAMSLGATRAQATWDIILPLTRTGIVVGFVFALAVSLDEVAASVFLTVPGTTTLPVMLFSDMAASFDLTIAAAAAVMMGLCLASVLVLDRLVGLERLLGGGTYGTLQTER